MKVRIKLDVELKHERTNEDVEKTVTENQGVLSTKTPQVITKASYKETLLQHREQSNKRL